MLCLLLKIIEELEESSLIEEISVNMDCERIIKPTGQRTYALPATLRFNIFLTILDVVNELVLIFSITSQFFIKL